jgi:NADH:ubiquinone oxidoreductase subunit 6 (subunit J)
MNLAESVLALVAGATVAAAAGVVLSRNMIHSALYLILTFLGVAGVYFTLGAGFLGLIQILVYAGAVAVLIIFAIMLVLGPDAQRSNRFQPDRETFFWGTLLAALMTLVLVYVVNRPQVWPGGALLPAGDSIGALADLMLGRYVVAFETAAILLLLAVVGAIILARGADEE